MAKKIIHETKKCPKFEKGQKIAFYIADINCKLCIYKGLNTGNDYSRSNFKKQLQDGVGASHYNMPKYIPEDK